MKVRVGVDASIDDVFLEDFTKEVQLVRIPEEPEGKIEVDFWVAAMPPRILRRQWPHLKGVQVVQVPWAGVDTLLKIFPPEVTLCDARGVHEIPTSEWAVAVILAMEKFLPFFIDMQRQGKWATGQQAHQMMVRHWCLRECHARRSRILPRQFVTWPVLRCSSWATDPSARRSKHGLRPSERSSCAWHAARGTASLL